MDYWLGWFGLVVVMDCWELDGGIRQAQGLGFWFMVEIGIWFEKVEAGRSSIEMGLGSLV